MPEPTHPSTTEIGIDMGVTRFATMSDGSVIGPVNSFRNMERRIVRAQRNLSRKQKFSTNWKKQKARLRSLHLKVARGAQ